MYKTLLLATILSVSFAASSHDETESNQLDTFNKLDKLQQRAVDIRKNQSAEQCTYKMRVVKRAIKDLQRLEFQRADYRQIFRDLDGVADAVAMCATCTGSDKRHIKRIDSFCNEAKALLEQANYEYKFNPSADQPFKTHQ